MLEMNHQPSETIYQVSEMNKQPAEMDYQSW